MNFAGVNISTGDQESSGGLDANSASSGLSYLAGTIDSEDAMRFFKVIFRTTKGNNWTYVQDIIFEEGDTRDSTKKSVFIVVYSGG